ncbi:SDR family NAD(P)-dependent oxidoreductase [Staphylococcus saccharolyticus]|uniref:SDR family NAD(P)-dependent oxidoreductase n=1 Tax=Staphylococcus saccharolyticus TaxID=33028 RepID=UPI0032DF6D21
MENLKKYIYEEVSKNNMSIDKAKELLGEIQKKHEDIAIVGIACKFANAENQQEFWNNLLEGREFKRGFQERRLNYIKNISSSPLFTQFLGSIPLKGEELNDIRPSGYLSDIDKFDPEFFNISPSEARAIDPDQRVMLENVQDALIDAGYTREKLNNSKTAVFIGKDNTNDTLYRYITEEESSSMTGNWPSLISGRISHLLNLKGPSLLIDSACSSGLTGVHLACKSLQNKESNLVIVGGVSINSFPSFNKFPYSLMESSDNTLRPFDENANGTRFCEGVATVILKPLNSALKDKNNVYAVIKGSAINNDGNTNGITSPNVDSQELVLHDAWKDAQINPENIQYIETHGTGTKIGDPIEVKGLTNAFSKHTIKRQFCGIGSVKGNIGHTVAASGLASLIKVALSLKNKKIPKTINFQMPNNFLNFPTTPLYMVNNTTKWGYSNNNLKLAGVSSFGFAGTNCHIVLSNIKNENIYRNYKENYSDRTNYIITLSAKNKNALIQNVKNYLQKLSTTKNISIEDISYTTTLGRDHFNYRLALLVNSVTQLQDFLREFLLNNSTNVLSKNIYFGIHKKIPNSRKPISEEEKSSQELNRLTKKINVIIEEEINAVNINKFSELICKYYIEGASINWDKLNQFNKRGKIISLPLYPYSKRILWGKIKVPNNEHLIDNNIHPLVHKLAIDSIKEKIYVSSLNFESHWSITDHQVKGKNVLPGTAHVEIIRKVLSEYLHTNKISLHNLIFYSPIVLTETIKEIQIIINKDKNVVQICSKNNNEFNIHSETSFEINSNDQCFYDIDKFNKKDDVKRQDINYKHNFIKNDTFTFGPRWLNFKSLAYRSKNAEFQQLAELRINDKFKDDLKENYIHSALLDNAVNLYIDENDEEVYLPFSYGKINIFHEMPEHFYSLVTKRETKKETKKFDISLINENNEIFIDIKDYIIKKSHNTDGIIRDNIFQNTYNVKWQPSENTLTPLSIDKTKIVILYQPTNFSKSLAKTLIEENPDNYIPICISNPKVNDETHHYLNLNSYDSYKELFKCLKTENIDTIVDVSLYEDFKKHCENSIDSKHYFYMFKALFDITFKTDFTYKLILNNAYEIDGNEDHISPTSTEISGFFKGILEEVPKAKFSIYDIDFKTDFKKILNEIWKPTTSFLNGYRNNKRYIPEIIKETEKTSNINKDVYSNSDSYLITGGLGDIGLHIAKNISNQKKVTFHLLTRRRKPFKDDILKEIANNGSTVCIHTLDITNEQKMKELSLKIGKVDGIFHCAGNAGDGFVYNKSITSFSNVLDPKKLGMLHIEKYYLHENIKFLVCFSSIVSLLGGAGQTDYAAGNSFMDGFIINLRKKGFNAISINWPSWKNIGMAKRYNVSDQKTIFSSISTEEATSTIEKSIVHGLSNFIPSNINYYLISQVNELLPIKFSDSLLSTVKDLQPNSRLDKTINKVTLKGQTKDFTNTEIIVSNAYANILNIKELDVFESFNSLGGDSIMATNLLKELEKNFEGIVEITDIFTYGSVKELSNFIDEELRKKNNAYEKNNDLISLMEELSQGHANVDETLSKLNGGDKNE